MLANFVNPVIILSASFCMYFIVAIVHFNVIFKFSLAMKHNIVLTRITLLFLYLYYF